MSQPQQVRYAPAFTAPEYVIIIAALTELASARQRYPEWPADIVHACCIMIEEATEVLKSANNLRWKHHEGTAEEVRKEVIQTIAMCLRLLTETPGLGENYPAE